jgi:hypothetical protein
LSLDDDAKRDTFFDLKYSDIIVDYLTLSHEAMQDLLELSRGAYDLISKLDKVYDLREEINKLDAVINKKKILDDTIKKASDTLESEYFINFGKPALQIADKHFRDWYAKYKWAH